MKQIFMLCAAGLMWCGVGLSSTGCELPFNWIGPDSKNFYHYILKVIKEDPPVYQPWKCTSASSVQFQCTYGPGPLHRFPLHGVKIGLNGDGQTCTTSAAIVSIKDSATATCAHLYTVFIKGKTCPSS